MTRRTHTIAPAPLATVGTEPIDDPIAGLDRSEASFQNFLELIRVLDERRDLRILHDLVVRNEDVVRIAVGYFGRPENLRAIQNLQSVLRAVQKLDPAQVEATASALALAMNRASTLKHDGRRRGALGVLRQLGMPRSNRGFLVLLELLKALGAPPAPLKPQGAVVRPEA